MAFIFNPNPNEGDRQTNDETGVEYVYLSGAWRPLGPKIDSQFDTLDERYVNADGDVMHGTLKFDHGADGAANILIRPNISNTSTSIYQLNGGALRFRSLPGEDLNDGSTSHIAIGKNETDGSPETYIYHLQDPDGPLHAVNLRYLETYVAEELGDVELSGYLPLTGGSMTGKIEVDRESGAGLELFKEGTSNLKLWVDGGITTSKTTFNDDQLVTKNYADTADGLLGQMITLNGQDIAKKVEKTGDTMTGELKINVDSGYNHLLLKIDGTNAVKVGSFTANETRLTVYNGQFFKVVGYVDDTLTQLFGVSSSGRVTLSNVRTPTANRDAATKAYVDSLLAAPARLSWKWDTGTGNGAPPTGAFRYTQTGSDYYYRFSFETAEGIKLGESVINDFNRGIDNGPVGTIWYKEANGWKFKQQFRINTFRWNYNNHFEFRVTSRNGSTSFTPGTPYHITVGGFF